MPTPPLRHDFVDRRTPRPGELPAEEYNRNAERTDEAWDLADTAASVVRTPYAHGAAGDGTIDDTNAVRSAVSWLQDQGGGTLYLPRGRFHIPDHIEILTPGVSIQGAGGWLGGGELRMGPTTYGAGSNGIDFSGTSIRNIVFDRGDSYGTSRELVLRNARGLDIESNRFQNAGKGIACEQVDGNDKFHTSAMISISRNRFGRLAFGVFGDTQEWDRLSDWQITDNFFNWCSDTSVWIASTEVGHLGGLDGLNFAGNTVFSQNYNSSTSPTFATKRHNLCLGKTNWLRILNNNLFEAGLSSVLLSEPQNMTFVGNHIAWPGQRDFSDALEIRGGTPRGVIEGNTFAWWTRAAIGLHDLVRLNQLEIGQNAWQWVANPDSWKGTGTVTTSNCSRVFATVGGTGYPIVRDFQLTGVYDNMKGNARLQARDAKTPKGGVTGSSRRSLALSGSSPINILNLSDIYDAATFGGLLSVTATHTSDATMVASYLLFVSSQGNVCNLISSGGHTTGASSTQPSFTWTLASGILNATPVGSTNSTFNFDVVSLGAVATR